VFSMKLYSMVYGEYATTILDEAGANTKAKTTTAASAAAATAAAVPCCGWAMIGCAVLLGSTTRQYY
jgi:hypothetical protein